MRLQLTIGAAWLAFAAACFAAPAPARADGEVTVRGAYYKERSTRVTQPMVDAKLQAGANGEVNAHFLIDTISSASAAAGAVGSSFNETRYEAGAAYTHDFSSFGITAGMRYSNEPDYTSRFAHARIRFDLAKKNASLTVGGAAGRDSISNGSAQGGIAEPLSGSLTTVLGSVSLTQVLSPVLLLSLTYDLSFLKGFQENPYRSVAAAGVLVPERVPERRYRNAVAASIRGTVPSIGTIGVASYRLYVDSWGIVAHTPEVRVIHPLGEDVFIHGRYRFYKQSAADFYEEVYDSANQMVEPHLTDDAKKLGSMTTHTVGGKLDVALGAFGVTGSSENTSARSSHLTTSSRETDSAMQSRPRSLWFCLLSISAASALSACGGSDVVCGPNTASTDVITVTVGTDAISFANFTSGANNDCPTTGSATSISIQGSQVAPAGMAAITLCLPSPEKLGATPVEVSDESLVRIEDLGATDGQGCTLGKDDTGTRTGTVTFAGFCDNGVHPDGYSISFEADVPGTRACPGMDPEPVALVLGGQASVTASGL